MLNEFFASLITKNQQYSKSFDERCNSLLEDKNTFMESNKMATQASSPDFIEYLEERCLTAEEINYACLYLIGLTGKEVGHYIQLKRHYHISSNIRKKLGIDSKSTNLGIYIRKLRDKLSNSDPTKG